MTTQHTKMNRRVIVYEAYELQAKISTQGSGYTVFCITFLFSKLCFRIVDFKTFQAVPPIHISNHMLTTVGKTALGWHEAPIEQLKHLTSTRLAGAANNAPTSHYPLLC